MRTERLAHKARTEEPNIRIRAGASADRGPLSCVKALASQPGQVSSPSQPTIPSYKGTWTSSGLLSAKMVITPNQDRSLWGTPAGGEDRLESEPPCPLSVITFRWGAAPGHSNELWGETGRGGQHTERDLWHCHAKRGTILPSSALVTGELMTVLEVTFTQKHPKESQSLAKVWASQQKKNFCSSYPGN